MLDDRDRHFEHQGQKLKLDENMTDMSDINITLKKHYNTTNNTVAKFEIGSLVKLITNHAVNGAYVSSMAGRIVELDGEQLVFKAHHTYGDIELHVYPDDVISVVDDPIYPWLFEIYQWQHNYTFFSNFNRMLLNLYMKAGDSDREKLGMAYPYMAQAVDAWEASLDGGRVILRQYGLLRD